MIKLWICEHDDCTREAIVHVGNSPADTHFCDLHAEEALRKYLAALQSAQRQPPALVTAGDE